jgi:hypothetical protein
MTALWLPGLAPGIPGGRITAGQGRAAPWDNAIAPASLARDGVPNYLYFRSDFPAESRCPAAGALGKTGGTYTRSRDQTVACVQGRAPPGGNPSSPASPGRRMRTRVGARMNHANVTLLWSGALRCGIAVVRDELLPGTADTSRADGACWRVGYWCRSAW